MGVAADDHPLDILVPNDGAPASTALPDQNAIAKALEAAPPKQFEQLSRVSINRAPNSQDTVRQKIYNKPDFIRRRLRASIRVSHFIRGRTGRRFRRSLYGADNPTEDSAESANMYWSGKGTPREQEGRKRYPARYEYFDKIAK
ncbi:hypothetical protein [Burkholderia vietnamiensis]|uniref:hypothetical protein n=1 Tax=Burkholderia vietnamiensis TaxID=60552 RepID=UPI00075527A2|nr:hypothetical protein [Burkholderia vietnamiensis]